MFKLLHHWFGPLMAPDGAPAGGGAPPLELAGGEGDGASGEAPPEDSSSEGTSYPGFHTQYPENVRGNEHLRGEDGEWLSPGAIAQAAIEYRSKAGSLVELPGEGASTEVKQEFARKIGLPESPAGYELQKPDDWPSTVPWTKEMQTGTNLFAQRAYAAMLPKEAAQRLYADSLAAQRQSYLQGIADRKTQQDEWDKILSERFGDQLDAVMHTADRAMTAVADPSVVDALKKANLARHPGIVTMFNRLWNTVGEDTITSGAIDSRGPGPSTPRERIRRLYNNTKFRE